MQAVPAQMEKRSITLETKYGDMQVTIEGDVEKQPVFITLHDIGLHHGSAFTRFTNQIRASKNAFNNFAVIHIDVPGQQVNAADIPAEHSWIEMNDVVDLVEQVRDHLRIKYFFAMGIGAGAYVMMKYATKHASKLSGMVLFGPTIRKCGWREWAYKWFALTQQKFLGDEYTYQDTFMRRWFSMKTLEENADLTAFYKHELGRMNQNNVYKFLQGYQRRKDIDIEAIKKLNVRTMIMVGDNTPHENEAVEILACMKPSQCSWIRVRNGGFLVTEEMPNDVLQPLDLFLQGFGFFG